MAVQFSLETTFDQNFGSAIAFNPNSGNLFVAQEAVIDFANFIFDTAIVEITTTGENLSSFQFPGSPPLDVAGMDFLPNGNLLLTSRLAATIQEFTPDGELVPSSQGGVEISLPGFADSLSLISSTVYDSVTDTIFVTDYLQPNILQYSTTGELLNTISLAETFANRDPIASISDTSPPGAALGFVPVANLQGITIDPITQNFLIVEDSGNAFFGSGGASSIYEFTREGDLVSVTNLETLGGSERFVDPEGLTIDPTTNTLYIIFDDDDDVFNTTDRNLNRLGNQIATFQLSYDPLIFNDNSDILTFTQAESNLVVESVSTTSTTVVQEIGVFFFDADGTIGGLSAGDTGFNAAALARTQVLQSLLANAPTDFTQSSLKRVLNNFSAGTQLGFVRANGGSILEAINGSTTVNLAFSTEESVNVTTTTVDSDTFALDFNGEFTINVSSATTSTIQTTSQTIATIQNSVGGGVAGLDFSSFSLNTNFIATVTREAAFNNEVVFYVADDASGTVGGIAPNSDGTYLAAVLDSLTGLSAFETNDQETASFNGSFSAGSFVFPMLLVDGDLADLQDTDTGNDPTTFFPFLGANSDGVNHVSILGDNVFGFEDVVGGGDLDYQDVIIEFAFS